MNVKALWYSLLLGTSIVSLAQAQTEDGKAKPEKSGELIEVRGTLRTGVMAIGGETTGTTIAVKSKTKECVEDAKSAVRWMRQNAGELGVDPERIVAAGGSAGGHIAACTALTPGIDAEGEDAKISSKPNALVLFNPVLRFSGIPQMMQRIGNDEALGKAISPTLHVKKDSPPTLILFGTADRLAGMGDELMRKSKELGHRAELFTAEGQPHGFFNRPPWLEKTTQKMDEFLVSIGYLENQTTSNDADWTSLFNSKNLDGWTVKCRPEDKDKIGYWKAVDGAITAETPAHSKHNYIWLLTEKEYGDFELKLKVQTYSKSTGNSGVQVRSRYDDEARYLDGPQIDINPPGPWRNGFIYDETRGAQIWLWPNVGKPANALPSHAPKGWKWFDADKGDVWNEVYIRCQGTKITSVINGVTIADYDGVGRLDDAAHRRHNVGMKGQIGLQIHPGGELLVRFKDIFVRELKGTSAAKITPKGSAKFDITTKKSADRVEVESKDDTTTLTVTSPSGIGGVTISPKEGQWPKKVVLRLRLKGLESLTISNGKVTLGASVSSQGDQGQRVFLKKGNQETPVGKDDQYGMEIKMIGGEKVPLKDGYFEMVLPEALLKDDTKTLTISWIDFYRG